jgi:hypothetical protein
MARLENWHVEFVGGNIYTPPEKKIKILKGRVYDRPGFSDGETIRTSAIQIMDAYRATTVNGSIYELGEPSPNIFTPERSGVAIMNPLLYFGHLYYTQPGKINQGGIYYSKGEF